MWHPFVTDRKPPQYHNLMKINILHSTTAKISPYVDMIVKRICAYFYINPSLYNRKSKHFHVLLVIVLKHLPRPDSLVTRLNHHAPIGTAIVCGIA